MVEQDHMPGLLAADIDAVVAHFFEDVSVANLRAYEFQLLAFEITFQP